MKIFLNQPFFVFFIIALLLFISSCQRQAITVAPNVTFTTLAGKKIGMAELKNQVVLVNFWATDCQACVKEMPKLISTYKRFHSKGFEIIAIAMPDDPPAQVLYFTEKKSLPFVVMDDGLSEMTAKFGNVEITPTTFIFDKKGKLIQHTVGKLDFVELDKLLNTEVDK